MEKNKVLVAGKNEETTAEVVKELISANFQVQVAFGSCEAGISAQRFGPDCVVIVFKGQWVDANKSAKALKENFPEIFLIALLTAYEYQMNQGQEYFDEIAVGAGVAVHCIKDSLD